MKVSTLALTGIALDYAVAQARGHRDIKVFRGGRHADRGWIDVKFNKTPTAPSARFDPGVNAEFAWPIIDSEGITVGPWDTSPAMAHYGAFIDVSSGNPRVVGSTKLEAAMRCYLFRRFGDEVDVPDSTMAGPHEQIASLVLPEDDYGTFWYIRENLEKGTRIREKFVPIHSPLFGDPKLVSRPALLAAMLECIATWNRQMPKTYRYRLETSADRIPTLTDKVS